MYAVVATLTFNDRSAAEGELSAIVSRVSNMPGFVGGYWVDLGADRGISVIVFDSQAAAQALATFASRLRSPIRKRASSFARRIQCSES